jgi:1,2-diacylglycerol 3-alpha-glucosyltransferase
MSSVSPQLKSSPSAAQLPALRTAFPRLGILNDYVKVPYANGSSFASQFLYREFQRRGAEVMVIGARDPSAGQSDLPPSHVCFSSAPLRNHPGVQIPLPDADGLRKMAAANLSMMVAQTGSALLNAGLWLRRKHGVPLVCVNTIHLPSVYEVMLPEVLHKRAWAHRLMRGHVIPWLERTTADIYNGSDGLVVLSSGLKQYWRDRGVKVPIWVIPRSVDPSVFDRKVERDPFPEWSKPGERLLVVCRHTREKNIARLLEIFARHIAPARPGACLALVGDGPDHDTFKAQAEELGVLSRCVFPGEVTLLDTPEWYRAADLFVYTSLSETYGQVVSEALWSGLPVVAFSDAKGVSAQVSDAEDGFLIEPDAPDANPAFGARVLQLLEDAEQRQAFSEAAQRRAHLRSDPARCIAAYEAAFAEAAVHLKNTFHPATRSELRAPIVRWASIHSLLFLAGWLRSPTIVNRHGRKQPGWDLPSGDARRLDGRPVDGRAASPRRLTERTS